MCTSRCFQLRKEEIGGECVCVIEREGERKKGTEGNGERKKGTEGNGEKELEKVPRDKFHDFLPFPNPCTYLLF